MSGRKALSRWALIAAAAALAAAALVFARLGERGMSHAETEIVSVAEARAIGARWRKNPNAELARDYAEALVRAGLYDDLLREIIERGLFSEDNASASLFRAEANLRRGRFDDALSAISGADENPYLSYVRARAVYALTADAGAAADDLARALRGPKALAADAWLFRARLALDANDLETAEAAARRAVEAGGSTERAEKVAIEKSIRLGDLGAAAGALEAREKRLRGRTDADDHRLAAMIKLRAGDARAAVRLIDLARAENGPGRLIAALAKWQAGDDAQGWSLVSAELAAAPQNWMALDLAAAIARDNARAEDASRLLARLEEVRPQLAFVRRSRIDVASPDEVFDELLKIGEDISGGGVSSALLGPGAKTAMIEEPDTEERTLIRLAAAINRKDARGMRAGAAALPYDGGSPIGLALAGIASLELGEEETATQLLARSCAASPDFLEPLKRLAAIHAGKGDYAEAAALLREYLTRHEENAIARLELAAVEVLMGDSQGAVRSFSALPPALVFADEEISARYGAAAKAAGGEALADMLRAARANAASARILAAALVAAGDDEGAAAALRKALIASPADDGLAAIYLDAMTRLGRTGEAQSLLGQIARRAPDASSGP